MKGNSSIYLSITVPWWSRGVGFSAFTAIAWVQFPVMEVTFRAHLMVQQVKNPPTMKETQKTWV